MSNFFRQIELAPAPLPTVGRHTAGVTADLSVELQAMGSSRCVNLDVPWIVRNVNSARLGPDWPAFCRLLRKTGAILQVDRQSLEELRVEDIPLRLARMGRDCPLDAENLATADVVEVALRPPTKGPWGWPIEWQGDRRLFAFVEALRAAAGGDAPVGLAMPLRCQPDDLRIALQAGVDFLTLVDDSSDPSRGWMIRGVRQARTCCHSEGMPDLPLLLDAKLSSTWEAFTCLALGASAYAIDGMLLPLIPAGDSAYGTSMLASYERSKPASSLDAMANKIQEAIDEINQLIANAGHVRVRDLTPNCLRALSNDVARMADLELL